MQETNLCSQPGFASELWPIELCSNHYEETEREKLWRGRYKELGEEIREMLTKGNSHSSKIPINP